ncbi:MAG: hypothetical protein Ct9H90mP7_4860 [Candidatus Neomarinimicrobiota bacterium]|nr:MAG: hypothetical protein Ct9H90mP7_4860 [Candidatus Neomarinimicrobiota bacterium]
MVIAIDIPALESPRKNILYFLKNPDQIKIKSRGFGLLPRTGMFTSPVIILTISPMLSCMITFGKNKGR